jgi:hypothetical protein
MKQEVLDQAFALLEGAAAKGRALSSDSAHGPIPSNAIGALARAARIRSKVYAHNWRVVEITAGPHKGKRTKAAPTSSPPYVVIDRNGRHGSRYGTHSSRMERLAAGKGEPSVPRLLKPGELR